MEHHRSKHCVYLLTYHLVLVSKYRRPCFTKEMGGYIIDESTMLCEKYKGKLIEGNHDADHVHLLIDMPPSVGLSKFIGTLKNTTSRMVRKLYAEHLQEFYTDSDSLWSDSYYLSTTSGVNIDKVKQYIEQQGKPKKRGRPRS